MYGEFLVAESHHNRSLEDYKKFSTLRKIHKRKSAAKIVDAMRTWTLVQFGFDDAKSKSIVAQMVQSRGARGESKVRVQLRF